MSAQVISFHCILKNQLGNVISSTFNKDVITSDSPEQPVLKGLIKGLTNLKPGEKRRITLSAQEAYGFYNPDKLIEMHRDELPYGAKFRLGELVILNEHAPVPQQYRVAEVRHDYIVFDGNHPLAGQDLIFEIEATEARDATREELLEAFEDNTDTRYLH